MQNYTPLSQTPAFQNGSKQLERLQNEYFTVKTLQSYKNLIQPPQKSKFWLTRLIKTLLP